MRHPWALLAAFVTVVVACGGSSFTAIGDGGTGGSDGGGDSSAGDASQGDGASGRDGSNGDDGGSGGGDGGASDGGGLGIEAGNCGTDAGLFSNVITGCTLAAGCVVVLHQVDCCGTTVAIGINHASRMAFDQDEAQWRASCPACGCAAQPTIAENGRPCDLMTCTVSCTNNLCRSEGP